MEFLLIFGVAMLVTVFIGTAVYFIMTYGTKEKTYEEAILEQRQRSEADVFFLGKSAKEKQKEKKLKKAGKKVKEKSEKAAMVKGTADSDDTEVSSHSHHKNQHVAFVTEAAIIEEPAPASIQEKKKKKLTKAKPILVNKDDTQLILEANAQVDVNHFETIHPKDDLEMRRQSKDESADHSSKKAAQKLIESEKVPNNNKSKKDKENTATKTESVKLEKPAVVKAEKIVNSSAKAEKPALSVAVPKPEKEEKKPSERQEKLVEKQQDKPADKIPVQEPVVAVATRVPAPVTSVPTKASKKKKGEPSLEQMTSGRDGINANLLEPLIHKAELSRSEIQNLIDLLLNKQQGSETEVAEWNEGRQDPMMKLKKAFAEKEKALQEEQEASLALQNKLREVRAELNAERSRLVGGTKQLEEKLLSRTNEIAAATAKFHHEKQTLSQQITQMKHQLEQEHQVIIKYREELGQAQNALQTQQTLEHHVANLTVQLQSQDQQMALLQQQASENQGAVQQCELLSAQVAQLQEQLKNAQNSSQGEVHAKQKQLTEIKAAKEDLERQLSVARQREGQLSSEVGKLKDIVTQRQSDIDKLAAEVSKLREENEALTSQVSIVGQLQMEARQLREENESLAAQVTAVTERPAAEGRENGDVAEEKHADGKLASAQLINDLRERDGQVQELLEQVKQAEKSASSTIDSLKSEINAHKNEIAQLSSELDQQRKKNDEAQKTVMMGEERKMREAMQRLFPSINIQEKAHDQWVSKFSAAALKHIAELGNKQPLKQLPDEDQSAVIAELEKRNTQLSGMVTNYKRIIEDTEGMLNKLQQHVEAEETKWQQQLADKEAELTAVIQERDGLRNRSSNDQSSMMQTQLDELHNKLQVVESERNSLKSQISSTNDTLATIEQLKDERNRLSSDLAIQQAKAVEQSNQLAQLKSLLEESEGLVSKEKASSQQLREEIEKLKESYSATPPSPNPSIQNHNGATNGPPSSVEPASAEKAASSKKKLSGWLKKKVVGSKSPHSSPNLSARGDDFLANERMESS